MVRKWLGLPKLVAVVGGFLTLAGLVLLGMATLSAAGYLNVSTLLETKHFLMVALVLVAVGLLDTFSAIIIARW
ncbi:hypothetical protein COS86_05465 [Candidatus Bathyarchaeota archaeon CG07_land_8_20_14_0_80_47_9]|nr:MAG: hypothetical protein COS86_05465 [Candidatus Bathyarchaeota archaeon CG07_land_8_20_14_0_80_47_9]